MKTSKLTYGRDMVDVGNGVIERVTVFSSGAYLVRTASVKLQQGLNRVRFSGLSDKYDKNYEAQCSVGQLISVNVENDIAVEYTDEITRKIDVIQQEIYLLTTQISVLDGEAIFWTTNYKTNESTNEKELERRAEYMRQKQFQIQKKLWERKRKLESLNSDLQKLEDLEKSYDRSPLCGACVVEILVSDNCTSSISITMFTSHAKWTPRYRIEKSGDNMLNVDLQGVLTQNTYEDWSEVAVIFVTGSPREYSVLPEFSSQYIGNEPVPMPRARMMSASVNADNFANYSDDFQARVTEQENENNISFTPNFVISIHNGMTSVIELNSRKIKATFSYQCMAFADTSVYMQAQIPESRFIHATARTFINGIQAGSTHVGGTMRAVIIGRDDFILVKRLEGNRYKTNKLLGGSKMICDYKLVIFSSKPEKIDINIIDRIPVSASGNIQVSALELSGATLQPESGKLEFALTLTPNKEQELKVAYSVVNNTTEPPQPNS